MNRKTTNRKPWTKMTLEELREATKQFDKPLPAGATRPMSPRNRARWERARRGSSRKPKITTVAVHMDPKLLERTDEYAKANGMTRDELINRSLKGVLAFAEG